jgi:hypothetical protein
MFAAVDAPFCGYVHAAGGKFFDPIGFSRGDAAMYKKYKQNEITNGRLAMVANLGFWAQYAATGKGPIENLQVGCGPVAKLGVVWDHQGTIAMMQPGLSSVVGIYCTPGGLTCCTDHVQGSVQLKRVTYMLTACSFVLLSFLQAHLADPYHVTFATNGVSVPFLHN